MPCAGGVGAAHSCKRSGGDLGEVASRQRHPGSREGRPAKNQGSGSGSCQGHVRVRVRVRVRVGVGKEGKRNMARGYEIARG